MGLFGTVCPVCGEKNKARLQYCVRCGSPLDLPSLSKAPGPTVAPAPEKVPPGPEKLAPGPELAPGPMVAPRPEKAPPSGGSRSRPRSFRAVYLVAWVVLLLVARVVPFPYKYFGVGAVVVILFVSEIIVRAQGRYRR